MISRLILLLCITTSSLMADTLDVGPSGEFNQVKLALSEAKAGDIIKIAPGTYQEGLIEINKPVTLLGYGYPIISASEKEGVFIISSDGVTISGLQIENVGTSYIEDLAGIRLNQVRDCTIEGNRLLNCFFGIYLQKSSDCIIRNNQVIGEATLEMSSGNAIHLWYCDRVRVDNNTVSNHRDGLYLEFVNNSVLSNNISRDNLRYGLHFMFSNDNRYFENRFHSNGAGVAVMFSRNISMVSNQFDQNWGTASYGLLLKEIYDGEISNNLFLHNTIGIYAESATRLSIKNNDFKNNGWALKIMGSCMDNNFNGNNFFTNTFDLTTSGGEDSNTFSGNYWSDYTGYDLDRNGFGDVPHRPVTMYAYLVGKVDVSILLLRSLFIEILNFAEKVTPLFVPEDLVDAKPLMRPRK